MSLVVDGRALGDVDVAVLDRTISPKRVFRRKRVNTGADRDSALRDRTEPSRLAGPTARICAACRRAPPVAGDAYKLFRESARRRINYRAVLLSTPSLLVHRMAGAHSGRAGSAKASRTRRGKCAQRSRGSGRRAVTHARYRKGQARQPRVRIRIVGAGFIVACTAKSPQGRHATTCGSRGHA